MVSAAIPDLADEGPQMIERFYAALTHGGPLNGALGGTMTAQGAWQPVTTEFAAHFLAFIRDPRLGDK